MIGQDGDGDLAERGFDVVTDEVERGEMSGRCPLIALYNVISTKISGLRPLIVG